MTPLTRSKTDCVPQKHPPAKTAVCLPGDWASASSFAASGTGVFVAAWQPAQRAIVTSNELNAPRREKTLDMHISRAVLTRIRPPSDAAGGERLRRVHRDPPGR